MTAGHSRAVIPLLGGRAITQVGILVADLDAALAGHDGLGPRERWHIVERSPSPGRGRHHYRGEEAQFQSRLAFSPSTPEVELIQPLSGPSIYEEWLANHGHGMHHLGIAVDSLNDAIAEMGAAGYEVVQSGVGYGPGGSGGYAYFDTEAVLGYLVEAIEHPKG